LNVFDDDNTQTAFLARLISVMESGGHWSITDAPEGLITRLMPMIRSFRIKVRTIEGITKLSQPTPMEDRHNVINALEHRDHDQDRSVAAWMRALSINS
jgi:predicted FMN-binding regulatory protein PaiB